MIARIVLGVAFLLCVAMAFMLSYRGRYENTSLVVLWCSMATISAMALFSNEIVSAIKGRSPVEKVADNTGTLPRSSASEILKRTPGWTKRENSAEPMPIGQRPGETAEQWAKRVEAEEAAAFRAKSRAPS